MYIAINANQAKFIPLYKWSEGNVVTTHAEGIEIDARWSYY